MIWPVEEIPDGDSLFFRVHYFDIDINGNPKPGAFRNRPTGDPKAGMSVNWDKYSSAENSRQNARKPTTEYSVVKMFAGNVREIPGQSVIHDPIEDPPNQSHSEVFGPKGTDERLKFMETYEVVIRFDRE